MQDSKSNKMNEVAIRKYVDSRNKNNNYLGKFMEFGTNKIFSLNT